MFSWFSPKIGDIVIIKPGSFPGKVYTTMCLHEDYFYNIHIKYTDVFKILEETGELHLTVLHILTQEELILKKEWFIKANKAAQLLYG